MAYRRVRVHFIVDFCKKNGIAYRNPENGLLQTYASNNKTFIDETKVHCMKTKYVIILAAFILLSCGKVDKRTKLAKLSEQYDKIAGEIKKLEDEVKSENGGKKTGAVKVSAVSIVDIKPQQFNHFVEVQGRLDGDENVAVSPKASGVAVAKFADVGDRVEKGQVLAQLDDAALQQQIQGAQSQVELTRQTYAKKKSLSDQLIYSDLDYQRDKTQMEIAERNYSAMLEQAEMYKIKSPVNGTVSESNFKEGQMVSPSMGTPAYRVVNFSKLKVVAEVAEAYSAKISKGDEVTIHFPDLSREHKANVTFVSDYINPVNRTFMVEVKIPNSESSLKVNMIAVLKINDYKADKTVAVSINTVLADQKGSYVFVAENSSGRKIAKKRYVKLGQIYDGIAEVMEGLREGDKLVTAGFQNIEEGDAVDY
jgi:RND family efflux transporter MFP subunit